MEGDRYWGEVRTPFDDADRYYAGFTLWGFTGWNGVADFDAVADTPARAICLAALAVGEETKG